MTNDITIIKSKGRTTIEKSLELCLQEGAVQEQSKSARDLFSNLQSELDELDEDFKDGLSYLDMKNDTLLSYMIDLCNIILRKVRQESISGHASIERSVYYRVILEKIKAIDQRLAYQLNKVISLPDEAIEGTQGVNVSNLDIEINSDEDSEGDDEKSASNDLSHRKRDEIYDDENDNESGEEDGEDEFAGSVDDEEEDGSSLSADDDDNDDDVSSKVRSQSTKVAVGGKDKKPIGIYRPPKLRSVAYNEGKRKSDSKRDREFGDIDFGDDDDDNQDVVDETNVHRDNERIKYEEDNYTRLRDTNPKKAKRKLKEKTKSHKGNKKFKGNNKKKNKW